MREGRPRANGAEETGREDGGTPGKMGLARPIARKGGGAVDGATVEAAVAPLEGATGRPLPEGPRAKFESSLGTDLGGVRVHDGAASAQAADAMGARAFATGQDVHFGAGEYRPEDPFGMHLLAHEVAHTVQQGGNGGAPQMKRVSDAGDALEREADVAADAMVTGAPAVVSNGGRGTVQRQEVEPGTGTGGGDAAGAGIDPPAAGETQSGFIDHDDGSNIRNRPAELAGSMALTTTPLPPATRVFVSGRHPDAREWLYVSAFLPGQILRGYVQHFRVTTQLPEPTAKLYQIQSGDTAEGLAAREFSTAVRDGHDLRYYENVLLHVNREAGRDGVRGEFQNPDLLGRGANNVQLVAGKRIWLVSPTYARALEAIVPDGSFTNGAVAGARRVFGHLEDIVGSVNDAPRFFVEVAGEYAQAILDHLPEIIGITAGFILAEAASAFLAATPTGVGQLAAVLIQLAIAAFGFHFAVEAAGQAVQHAERWLTQAWSCNGDLTLRAEASKSFLRMLVQIAMAALAIAGTTGSMNNALRIADSIHITPPTIGMSPQMVTPEGLVIGGGPTFHPGSITSTGAVAINGTAAAMTGMSGVGGTVDASARARGLEDRARRALHDARNLPDEHPGKWELIQRAEQMLDDATALRELAGEAGTQPGSLTGELDALERELATLEGEVAAARPVAPAEAPTSTVPRPHLRHPANQLPVEGAHPYEPPVQAGAPETVRAPEGGGFLDRFGNRWEWAHDQHGGPHWDVQHPSGAHTNVYPDGMVHQGADNF